ncbi:MAG: RHS repeat-associated core domain-containing protein [Candidatus Hydrogenedentes bacterium]|nr:RHS repeat-associated core domain-containing protein [Candidatus Hydrogenedentota bacterium]
MVDIPNGMHTEYAYDTSGRQNAIHHKDRTTILQGFDVISTEDDADGSTGTLTMTNVVLAPTAQVSATLGGLAGTTPSSGTARYYATDHLGSTRSAWDGSKASVGAYEFTPYGGEYNHTGAALDSLAGAYTGKPWDGTAQLFHFPYRQYSPDMARWTTRDPLGMVDGLNLYGYVVGNPNKYVDDTGGGAILIGGLIGGGVLLGIGAYCAWTGNCGDWGLK